MSKPVKIGKHNFPTQRAAKEFTQAILDKWYAKHIKHNNGSFKNDAVLIDDDDDRRFISALFRRHPVSIGPASQGQLESTATSAAMRKAFSNPPKSFFRRLGLAGHPIPSDSGTLAGCVIPASPRPATAS